MRLDKPHDICDLVDALERLEKPNGQSELIIKLAVELTAEAGTQCLGDQLGRCHCRVLSLHLRPQLPPC